MVPGLVSLICTAMLRTFNNKNGDKIEKREKVAAGKSI